MLAWRSRRPEVIGVLATPGWRAVFLDRMAIVIIEEDLAERLELPSVLELDNPPETETDPDR